MNKLFFQFTSNIYAAYYREQIILLDIINDEYFFLQNNISSSLNFIVSTPFVLNNGKYIPLLNSDSQLEMNSDQINKINSNISCFLNKGFIEKTINHQRKSNIARAREPIGLNQIEWSPTLSQGKVSLYDIFKTLFTLNKVHRTLKKKGMSGLITLIEKKAKMRHSFSQPTIKDVERFARALDKSSRIYPKKTLCLPWAATLMLLLSNHSWRAKFLIGIQTEPFAAHAWVEVADKVINDNPELKHRLAPIFTVPN